MSLGPTACRRWIGGLVLGAAVLMLVAGQTVLAGRLDPVGFLVYWSVCLVLTGTAIIVAFRDLRALRRRSLEEQRNLFHTTLGQIAAHAKARPRRHAPHKPGEPR
jgi:hypothetical protein